MSLPKLADLAFTPVGSYSYDGQRYLREIKTMEIVNPHSHGGKNRVEALDIPTAKALISHEYGFEFNSIQIEGVCWYDATDYNYFRFSVCGWQYEVKNFGLLEVVDNVKL